MTTENSSQESSASQSTTVSSGAQPTTPVGSQSPTTPAAVSTAPTTSQGSDALGADGQPAAYAPNYKFKAFGKEHEIEEMYRGLIKDKDTEEKVRKFHEKAYAMEKFQEGEKKYKTDFDTFRTKVEPDLRAMNHFNHLLQNKDWDNFFSGLRIPEQEIFDWVSKRLDLMKLPPDQREQIERASQARQQNYMYEQQFEQQNQSYQQLAVQTRTMQLESVLSRHDVSSQAERIDQAYGEIGAFRKLVIEEAHNHYLRTQQDIPADQAVQMTLQRYGKLLGPQAAVLPQPGSPASVPQGQGQPGVAPIIPHVAGSGRSPVKKSFKSLDDLKAHVKTL